MPETLHIQSAEYRQKIIGRFCFFIILSSVASVILYIFLDNWLFSAITGIFGLVFFISCWLNKRGYFRFARTIFIISTNSGILIFSVFLGYESGIYFYILCAPLLIYLLYDFNDKKPIIFVSVLYGITFVGTYLLKDFSFSGITPLSGSELETVFKFNVVSTFVLISVLVTFFAYNNSRYIKRLKHQQEVLTNEIKMRTKSEKLLQKSLKEREMLLSEIHHRVKNNLAIVTALLNFEKGNINDDNSRTIFEETKNRIFAISLVHNLLYDNSSFEKIDMVSFFKLFCENILESYANKNIQMTQSIDDVCINIKTAVPLAILVNEIVNNSMKNAFQDDQSGSISIGLESMENNSCKLFIHDTGTLMSPDIFKNQGTQMDIIHSLLEQLDAEMNFEHNNGNRFTVVFKIV